MSLVDYLQKKKIRTRLVEGIKHNATLVEPSSVVWKRDKLFSLLESKDIDTRKVFEKQVTYVINEEELQELVKKEKLSLDELETVSEEQKRKPYIRFYLYNEKKQDES